MDDPYYQPRVTHAISWMAQIDPNGRNAISFGPDATYYQPYNEQDDLTMYMQFEPSLAEPNAVQQTPTLPTESTVVSVSTTFFPGSHSLESDLCFSSSDSVLFYAHSQVIIAASEKAFSSFLSGSCSEEKHRNVILNIPEESAVLNVILHVLYNISCAQHSPTLQTLVVAVDHMQYYDIKPKKHLVLGTPLYMLLLSHAPLYPMDVYSLAANFDLEDLAVNSSSHLLSYPLSLMSDEVALRVGPIYLKRLACLQLGRNIALKNILLMPPPPHPPTKECTFSDQKKLTRAWALVTAYLAWDARPDLSTCSMQRVLTPLTDQLTCDQCHLTLGQRVKKVVVQWASVKRTI